MTLLTLTVLLGMVRIFYQFIVVFVDQYFRASDDFWIGREQLQMVIEHHLDKSQEQFDVITPFEIDSHRFFIGISEEDGDVCFELSPTAFFHFKRRLAKHWKTEMNSVDEALALVEAVGVPRTWLG